MAYGALSLNTPHTNLLLKDNGSLVDQDKSVLEIKPAVNLYPSRRRRA